MKQSNNRVVLGGVILAGAVGLGGFAFTASNTVPTSKAGDGTGAVTGYVVSNIDYTLNAANPSLADSVSFTLDATPSATSTLRARISGNWYTCTSVTTAVTCPTTSPQATVSGIVSIQVVIAD